MVPSSATADDSILHSRQLPSIWGVLSVNTSMPCFHVRDPDQQSCLRLLFRGNSRSCIESFARRTDPAGSFPPLQLFPDYNAFFLIWNQGRFWSSCTRRWPAHRRRALNPCRRPAAGTGESPASWGSDRWTAGKCRDSRSCSGWPAASGLWKSQLEWQEKRKASRVCKEVPFITLWVLCVKRHVKVRTLCNYWFIVLIYWFKYLERNSK